jgi:hypothetical protein
MEDVLQNVERVFDLAKRCANLHTLYGTTHAIEHLARD